MCFLFLWITHLNATMNCDNVSSAASSACASHGAAHQCAVAPKFACMMQPVRAPDSAIRIGRMLSCPGMLSSGFSGAGRMQRELGSPLAHCSPNYSTTREFGGIPFGKHLAESGTALLWPTLALIF
jgi:hypothetical protein